MVRGRPRRVVQFDTYWIGKGRKTGLGISDADVCCSQSEMRALPAKAPSALTASGLMETSRIAVVSLTSDDGLHVPIELVDRALDLPCELDLTATGGAIGCVPRGTREARYYADASCRVVELDVSYGDEVPPIAWTRDPAGCRRWPSRGRG